MYIQILFTFWYNVYSLAYMMSLTKIIGNIWDGGISTTNLFLNINVWYFLLAFKWGLDKFHKYLVNH